MSTNCIHHPSVSKGRLSLNGNQSMNHAASANYHVVLWLLLVVREQLAIEHKVARVEEGPADLPAAVAHHPALVAHGGGGGLPD